MHGPPTRSGDLAPTLRGGLLAGCAVLLFKFGFVGWVGEEEAGLGWAWEAGGTVTLRGEGLAWRGSAFDGGGMRAPLPSGDVGTSLLSPLRFGCADSSPALALYLSGGAGGVGWSVRDAKGQIRGAYRTLVSSWCLPCPRLLFQVCAAAKGLHCDMSGCIQQVPQQPQQMR